MNEPYPIKMYKIPKMKKTAISRNVQKEGEPMHEKIERLKYNKELKRVQEHDNKPLVYTERDAGVVPQTDWRTDKWENAAAASGKLADDYVNNRGKNVLERKKGDGKPEPTAGQGSDNPTGNKP